MNNKKCLVIYFASSPKELYQLYMWDDLLSLLSENYHINVVFRNPLSFYKYNGKFERFLFIKTKSLYQYVESNNIASCIYVNNTLLNYHMLKFYHFPQLHIGHGESDKSCSQTFHFNAYSHILVAGEAAEIRLKNIGIRSDQIFYIGRPKPKVSSLPIKLSNMIESGKFQKIIAYTPTWEGGSSDTKYSSIASVGIDIINYYKNFPDHLLIFKPHPLIGKKCKKAKKSLHNVKSIIDSCDNMWTHEGAVHDIFPFVDGIYTDISSVVVDYLSYSKPYVTYVPDWEMGRFAGLDSVKAMPFSSDAKKLIAGFKHVVEKKHDLETIYRFYVNVDTVEEVKDQVHSIIQLHSNKKISTILPK